MFVLRHAEKDYNLSEFEGLFGTELLLGIVKVYKSRGNQLAVSTMNTHVAALKKFKEYVLSLNRRNLPEPDNHFEWAMLVSNFRGYLEGQRTNKDKPYSLGLLNKHISGLNFWLRGLSAQMLLPRLHLKLNRSGDVVSNSLLDFELPSSLGDVLQVDEDEGCDINLLYRHIIDELGEVDRNDIPRQAAMVLKIRVDAVRKEAQKTFEECLKSRLEGIVAIRRGRKNSELFKNWLSYSKKKDGLRVNPHQEEIENLTNKGFCDGLLSWLWYSNGGMELKYDSMQYLRVRRQIQTRKLELSDKDFAAAMGCTIEMISSATLLLVGDLAANVSSVTNMDLDGFENIDGINSVFWEKNRAAAELKSVKVEINRCSPSFVFRRVKSATKNYRKICLPSDQNKLFLHFHSNKTYAKHRKSDQLVPCSPSAATITKKVREIIHRASKGRWVGTAKSLRISILLLEGLTGGIAAVKVAAQHASSRTSQLYGNKVPMLIKHDQDMRIFKTWLQTLITIRLNDVPRKLGINVEIYEAQKKELLGSQFGGNYCRDPLGGIQPGSFVGEVCGQFSKCMTCDNRSHFIIASESNVLHALQWEQAIIFAEQNGKISGDDTDWGYWKLFIETVRSRFRSGERFNASILRAAEGRLSSEQNPYLGII